MKHFIAALSLSVLSAPAIADAVNPFDQEELSRAQPSLVRHMGVDYPFGGTPPYNRLEAESSMVASGGNTRSDVEISAGTAATSESPWAGDHNFIAPAA